MKNPQIFCICCGHRYGVADEFCTCCDFDPIDGAEGETEQDKAIEKYEAWLAAGCPEEE